jgi:hypothetical protein
VAKAKAGGGIKLVRRNIKTGDISARKRGRPGPDFETGWVDGDGTFHSGNPRRGRRRGRKPGRKPGRPAGVRRGAGRMQAGGGLSEIEKIVRREVDSRLKAAREAAISAFNTALGL